MNIELEEIADIFKSFMKDAYYTGWELGLDKGPPKFTEWFEKNYGDIIGIGTEAPANEKVSEKEGPGPNYFGPQYF
jgi:hypothetical protein